MKKLIALILVLALVLSLAACSGSGSTSTPSGGGSSSSAGGGEESKASESSGEGESSERGSGEIVTLKVLSKNDYDSLIKIEDWQDYDVSQKFIQTLADMGLAIEIEAISNDSFKDVLATRMAAAVDLPDIVGVAFDATSPNDIVSWGQNGLIIPASDLMEQYDEDGSIAAYWDERCPGTREAQIAPDGKIYWFCYLYNQTTYDIDTGEEIKSLYGFRCPSIRADWVAAVGEELKPAYTHDELFNLLKKIQDEDANGNGANDEVVTLRIGTFYDNLARSFGLNTDFLCFADQHEEKIKSNFYDERLVDYLEYMKKMYDAGLYDTASMSGDQFTDELITSNRAALTYNYGGASDYETQSGDPNAEYAPIIVNETGSLDDLFYLQGDTPGIVFNQYFVTSACEHPEAAAKLFDYIYSDDYAYPCNGVDLDNPRTSIDENGVITTIPLEEGEDPIYDAGIKAERGSEEWWTYWHKYAGLNGTGVGLYSLPPMVTLKFTGYEIDPKLEDGPAKRKQERVAEVRHHLDNCDYQKNITMALLTEEESERLNELSEALSTYGQEMITDMILGDRPISDLEAGVAEMESLGLTEYMEIMQGRLDRTLGK